MAFIVETHMHTAEISPCGKVPAFAAAAQYAAAGVDALIVTDHLRRDILDALGGSWTQQIDRWLEGYRRTLAAGRKLGLRVWLGAEITLGDAREDYLLYGLCEDFLRQRPGITQMGLQALSEAVRREGLLLVQAHPFRPYAGPAEPRYLDGLEIMNGNPRQESNNGEARAFCLEHGLIATGGSDYHQPQDLLVGMAFDRPLGDIREFTQALREGRGRIADMPAAESARERGVPARLPGRLAQ